MAYITMLDLLRRAQAFHQNLARYYDALSHEAQREDVKFVLEYMSRHEQVLEECIRQYERDAPKGVLRRWFQYSPETGLAEMMRNADLSPDMDVGQVIRTAMEFDDALIKIYRQLRDIAVPSELQDALTNLIEMEETEKRRMVRKLQENY